MKWLFFILILLPIIVRGQAIKKDTVLLKSFNKGDTVIYDIGDDKLYFELSVVLKYLKDYRGANLYKKQHIAILTKALEKHLRGSFYLQDSLIDDPQTGLIDTAAMQNKYINAMQEVIPAMLSDGCVMVRDVHDHLIPYLLITKRENGNYIGAYTEFTAFFPDGKRLYKTTIYHQ